MAEQSQASQQLNDSIKQLLTKNGLDWEQYKPMCQEIKQLIYLQGRNALKGSTFKDADKGGGNDCPVCGRKVKLRKVSINKNAGKCLIKLYNVSHKSITKSFHVDSIGTDRDTGGSWAALRFWNLIVPEKDEKGKVRQGYWKITKDGINFVEQRKKIKKYARVYDKQVYRHEGGDITILDIVGGHDTYNSLINR